MNESPLKTVSDVQHAGETDGGLERMVVHPVFICLLLAVITSAIYWPVMNCDFTNLDDPDYFTANPHVLGGLTWADVGWAFHMGDFRFWHPLTWLSLMLDVTLFGKGAGGPHFTNLLLHTANTVLVFLVFRRLTGAHWRSALVAGLFALHPLRVESVAWVCERKDVLSTLFWLLTLWTYSRHAAFQVSSVKRQAGPKRWYGLALLFFALGLLSKPMLVTVPFVMLLLDYWPLRRVPSVTCQVSSGVATDNSTSFAFFSLLRSPALWRLVREKIPFFALSAISCVVTFSLHRMDEAVITLADLPAYARIENGFVSYARYFGKTFWPVDLATPYPYSWPWPMILVVCATGLVMGLCVAAVWLGRRRPYVFVGWFWFVGTLIPVIGLIQVGPQAMADRFTYVPLIGLFIILAWSAGEMSGRWQRLKGVIIAAAVLALAACGVRTRDQLRNWQNSETLFRHALAVSKDNYLASNYLGLWLLVNGRTEEAMDDFRRALQICPDYPQAHFNLAVALARQHKFEEAIAHYREVLRLDPNNAEAHLNLGSAFLELGRLNEAEGEFTAALRINPYLAAGYYNLANVLDRQNRGDDAVRDYQEALRLKPDYAEAHNNLGNILAMRGELNKGQLCISEPPSNTRRITPIRTATWGSSWRRRASMPRRYRMTARR